MLGLYWPFSLVKDNVCKSKTKILKTVPLKLKNQATLILHYQIKNKEPTKVMGFIFDVRVKFGINGDLSSLPCGPENIYVRAIYSCAQSAPLPCKRELAREARE